MSKFLLFILIVSLFEANIFAQGQPYTADCKEDDRCNKCRVYQKLADLFLGKITAEQFESFKIEEEKWIAEHCKEGSSEEVGEEEENKNKQASGSDSCWGKRNFFLQKAAEGVKITVCRTELDEKGECATTDDCIDALLVNKPVGARKLRFHVDFIPPLKDKNLEQISYNILKEDWGNTSNKVELPAYPFCVILPSADDSTSSWLALSNQKIISLQGIHSTWFDYFEKSNHYIVNFFRDIALVYSYADNNKVSIIDKLVGKNENEELRLSLAGYIDKNPFLICIGYRNKEPLIAFNPFENIEKRQDLKLIFPKLVDIENRSVIDRRLRKIIDNWFNGGEREYIQNFLPESNCKEINPIKAISYSNNECISSEIKNKILNNEQFKILTVTNYSDYIVRGSNNDSTNVIKKPSWGLTSEVYKDCHLELLALADPTVNILGNKNGKIIFFFKDQYILYGWINDGAQLTQHEILKGNDILQLTGRDCDEYLESLMKSGANYMELEFFNDFLDKPYKFTLLDIFNFNNKNSRLVLWTPNMQPQIKNGVLQTDVMIIGSGFNRETTFSIWITDDLNQVWESFRDRYNTWIRDKIYSLNLFKVTKQVEFWISSERLGVLKRYANSEDADISIYLIGSNLRSFGEDRLNRIISLIRKDEIIFIGHPSELSYSNRKILFKSWLSRNWDRKKWRANPLGYFDRILN